MQLAVALSLLALHVPLPTGVTILEQPCPVPASDGREAACADVESPGGPTVYVPTSYRGTDWRLILAHELGHVWDWEHMTDDARARYSALIGAPATDWANLGARPPTRERFADAYALCAVGARERAWRRKLWHTTHSDVATYGKLPRIVVAATCWLLRHPPR